MNNADGLYIPNGARTNMGVKVQIKRGIQTASGPYWWKRGVFVLSDPSAGHKGAEKLVNLNGVDKWALHNGDLGGTLTETTVIAKDTNLAEAVRAVATDGGETKFAFDVCSILTPYTITKEPKDTRADLMKELALIGSLELYYDVDGYLRFRPIVDPLQKQIVADLSVGGTYRKFLVDSEYNPEWSKIKNYWKVIGYSDSDTGIIHSGIAQDNNPLSPTNTATPTDGIGVKAEVLTDDNIITDDLCEQRGAYELRKNLTKIDRSSHSIIPLPFLDEGDCIQLEDSGAGIDDAKYEIQALTEPLGLGLMQIECWKCTTVFEIILTSTFDTSLDGWQQLGTGSIDVFGFSGNNCMRKSVNGDPNGGYKTLDKAATDFEFIVCTRRDSVGSGVNQYSIVNSSGTGYGIGLDYTNNLLSVEKRTAWAVTALNTVAITPSLSEWYTLRLIKIGSNFTAEIHEGETLDFSNPITVVDAVDDTTTLFDRVAVNGGYTFYTDDVEVRKLL